MKTGQQGVVDYIYSAKPLESLWLKFNNDTRFKCFILGNYMLRVKYYAYLDGIVGLFSGASVLPYRHKGSFC